jgi:signal transduction histidine kinase
MRRQAIEAEDASHSKTQLLDTMSHEFRTPLNAILGYTQILLKGVSGGLTAGQKRNLERVDSNAKQLLAIINDILDLSRIEAGEMPPYREKFDVAALLAEVTAEVESFVDRTKVSVESSTAANVPLVDSDRAMVKQIVMKLVSNAIKFTPRGTVLVTASHDRARKVLRIAVTDTGIGIPRQDQARILDDSLPIDDSTTRPYGGAGLGLAICKRLAGILGGRITLASRVGHGSTFTLLLPARAGKS